MSNTNRKAVAIAKITILSFFLAGFLFFSGSSCVFAQPAGANTQVCTGAANLTGNGNGSVNWTVTGVPQDTYQVQIDNNSDFSSPTRDSGAVSSTTSSYSFSGLAPGTYYWRVMVRAVASGTPYWTPWANADVSFVVLNPPTPIISLRVQNSMLEWSYADADSCTASGDWSGAKPVSGSESIGEISGTKTYIITCAGPGGTIQEQTSASAPGVSMSAAENPIEYNTSTTISWSSTDADSCAASGGWSGSKPVSGSQSTGNLTSSRTYTLTCTGPGGASSGEVTVTVFNDFDLTSSNSIFATTVGSLSTDSSQTTITVAANGPFNSNVSLSIDSVSPALPAGTVYHFSDTTLTSSEYSNGSQFYVTIPGTTSAGLYTITIKGEGGGLIRTVPVVLNVEAVDPGWIEI
jgi:hypothetical protein